MRRFPLVAFLPLLVAPAGEEDVRALLPDAKETKRVDARPAEADRAAIAASVGREGASGPELELYRTKATFEGEIEPLRVAVVPAKGSKGDLRVAVAVNAEGVVASAKVLGDAGKAGDARFLAQFLGSFATVRPTATSWKPLALLEERRRAAEGDDAAAKRLRALLDLKRRMSENQSDVDAIGAALAASDHAGATSRARRLTEGLVGVAGAAPDLAPVLDGKETEAFAGFAAATKRVAERLVDALEKRDAAKAQDVLEHELAQSCGRCHGWDDHKYRRPLTNAFEALRAEAGLGNGYFLPGHDVVAAPEAAADSRAVSLAIKEALLTLQKVR